jgi:thiol-disulfide isomerase/thioredoxin
MQTATMSRRRVYLIAAIVLVVVAVGAVALAATTKPSSVGGADAKGDGSTAPALDAKGWVNSRPLTPAALKGKVVLYDFWTYSCVNCVRTIPYIRSWYDRYKNDGLVIVGVHSPEFDFEKNHANVHRAVKKLGVDYPVALDDDMTIWTAFGNQYWPADYLYDRSDHQADVHFGEGGYGATENEIRKLLGVKTSSPRAKVRGHEGGTDGPVDITPETYNGSERGAERFVSPQELTDGTQTFSAPPSLATSDHALVGPWKVTGQYVESAGAGASLLLRYDAGQVNLVMATANQQPIDVKVQVDDQAAKTVRVQASDLYNLVSAPSVSTHTLRITPIAPGLQVYAFTFGG